MTFKALLAASILFAPALAHAEGHANVKHYANLTARRCHYLTADELMHWGNRCPALAKAIRMGDAAVAADPSFGDLSDNKNELPNRGTAHGGTASLGGGKTPAGTIGQSYAYRAAQGTLSAEQIGTVSAATINNERITRANQAAYVAAHPAPQPAKTPATVTAVSPKSPAPPTTKTNPQPPSQPAIPPSKPSVPSVPSKPGVPSAPPAPPSKPVPPAPPAPPSKPVPPAPPVHHHPAPPPSHPGNPGHGGQGGCSGRGK